MAKISPPRAKIATINIVGGAGKIDYWRDRIVVQQWPVSGAANFEQNIGKVLLVDGRDWCALWRILAPL